MTMRRLLWSSTRRAPKRDFSSRFRRPRRGKGGLLDKLSNFQLSALHFRSQMIEAFFREKTVGQGEKRVFLFAEMRLEKRPGLQSVSFERAFLELGGLPDEQQELVDAYAPLRFPR
jgi:hypothetical protein